MQWSVFRLLNHPAEHITPGELNILGPAMAREKSIWSAVNTTLLQFPRMERECGERLEYPGKKQAPGAWIYQIHQRTPPLHELLQLCHNLARRIAQINDRKPNK